jgi:SSS family solute:Na+ symporter
VTWIDYAIFALYMAGVVGVGVYFLRKNTTKEDYYVGGRKLGATHVGLSVVATDVGGGFSIGLGGLGYAIGLSGSWLLFTGLVGAWGAAVLVIPRLKRLDRAHGMLTYPDFLRHRYGDRVALVAAVISGVGYTGFTGGQILAGAKLASATILPRAPFGIPPLQFALGTIAVVTILYTVIGGLKAVIYTDTFQWLVLLLGLAVTVPVVVWGELGGPSALRRELPAEFFTLTNLSAAQAINWAVTIIPIWLIGMTLYQRMFACGSTKQAQRAWYIAGLLEWPVMAFLGVFLGMCSRVMFPAVESEMGLPLLIETALPVGLTGLVIASYFSAIMSTADSCMMAASGNFVSDVIGRYWLRGLSHTGEMRLSQAATAVIGIVAVVLASQFEKVLDAMLHAYAFMVSGLFVPTLGAYFWPRGNARAAAFAMVLGGGVTLVFTFVPLPYPVSSWGLDPIVWGLLVSALAYLLISLDNRERHHV